MSVVGIIAEFNPLHLGHEHLLKAAKALGTVVVILSGNFVQRGDTAIAEKRIRTAAAIKKGADVVIELPVLWSMSTAQNFALGGVSAAVYAGCDTLMFGSECGDIALLEKTAEILQSQDFSEKLEGYLKKGITFASARQSAAEECGAEKDILKGANNNLAIEYIIAAKKLGAKLNFKTVKRIGAPHDSLKEDKFVSATLLREKLLLGDYDFCGKYMSKDLLENLKSENLSNIKNMETAILSVLRTRNLQDLNGLPDLSEGVENKLYSAVRLATSLESLYNNIKVKRYTLARIRRLVLWAFIGGDNSFFMKPLPYIRVLGFSEFGEEFLKVQIKKSPIPIILRAKEIEKLDFSSKKVFETESRATDLFALSVSKPLECGLEYTSKLIKGWDKND